MILLSVVYKLFDFSLYKKLLVFNRSSNRICTKSNKSIDTLFIYNVRNLFSYVIYNSFFFFKNSSINESLKYFFTKKSILKRIVKKATFLFFKMNFKNKNDFSNNYSFFYLKTKYNFLKSYFTFLKIDNFSFWRVDFRKYLLKYKFDKQILLNLVLNLSDNTDFYISKEVFSLSRYIRRFHKFKNTLYNRPNHVIVSSIVSLWSSISFLVNQIYFENFIRLLFQRVKLPFKYGFFFIKSTRTNHFFFFGSFKQGIHTYKTFVYGYKEFHSWRNNEYFYTDMISRGFMYKFFYRNDNFKSAGSFKLKKKDKRTYQVIESVKEITKFYMIRYVSLNKIDFFFIYIKGFFKHVKQIFIHFKYNFWKSIWPFNTKMVKFNNMFKIFYRKVKSFAECRKSNYSSCINSITKCIKAIVTFLPFLNSSVSENTCLVGDLTTLKTFTIYEDEILDYKKYPYIFLSRNITTFTDTFNFSDKVKKKLIPWKLRKELKQKNKFVYTKKQLRKKRFFKRLQKKKNMSTTLYNKYKLTKSIDKPIHYNTSINDKDGQHSLMKHLITELAKGKIPFDKQLDDSTLKTKEQSSNSSINLNSTDAITTSLLNKLVVKTNKLNLKLLLVKRRLKSKTNKISNIYKYIHKPNPISSSLFIRVLIKLYSIKLNLLQFYLKITRFKRELSRYLLKAPKAYFLVDITSYPYNGNRRTRHYPKRQKYKKHRVVNY